MTISTTIVKNSYSGDGSTSTAIEVTNPVIEVNATSAAAPCTLADGANGQIKTILNTSTSGTNAVTITPSNLKAGSATAIVLNKPGESVTLIFKNSNWYIVGGYDYSAV